MERKVVLYIAMSLDGYIADEEGRVDFIQGHNEESQEDDGYERFEESVDTIIMGYQTYNQINCELSPGIWPYPRLKSYVFTKKPLDEHRKVTFVHDDLEGFVAQLKKQQGKNIWICGGANVVEQLMKADLIDIYHITIVPTLLCKGTRLFVDGVPTNLYLNTASEYDGMITLEYFKRA